MKYTLAALLFIGLLACENNKPSKPHKPLALFSKEFHYIKSTDLSKELGDTFSIEWKGESRKFAVSYNKKSKENEILELGKGVFFKGTVSTYKNLFFLNSKADNGFKIAAINVEDNNIQGLAEIEKQQEILEQRIIKGLHPEIIESKTENTFVLKTDKKEMLTLFSTLLLEFPTWQKNN